jgi:tetratricopeptide (TPR) repeat protein
LNSERSEPDAYSLGNAYVGLGNVACLEKKLDDALDLYNKSLDLFRRINLDQCIAGSYNCIAKVLALKGKSNASLEFYNKSIALSEKNNAKSVLLDAYQGLVTVYSGIGDHKNAFKALEVCFGLKDSLLNESKLKLIDEMEAKYETAKKDKELILQKAELEKQQADAREKSMQRNIFIVAFVAMALLVFAVLRSYNQKKKASAEISKQKEIIEEKQKEILDSIRYAKRIQKALITSERYVERNLDRLKKDD